MVKTSGKSGTQAQRREARHAVAVLDAPVACSARRAMPIARWMKSPPIAA
ncbi:MAG: hypothetical protein R3E50_13610 [Halioglobus sp.]